MMTNSELRKQIREDLKKLGLKRGDFSLSVRDSGCSDTCIRLTIKSPYVNKNEVEKVLLKYEDIDRDQRTFEILQGCNTFVNVSYKYGIFDELCKNHEQEAHQLWQKVLNNHGAGVIVQSNNKKYEIVLFKDIDRTSTLMAFCREVGKNVHEKIITIYDLEDLSKYLFQLHELNAIVF